MNKKTVSFIGSTNTLTHSLQKRQIWKKFLSFFKYSSFINIRCLFFGSIRHCVFSNFVIFFLSNRSILLNSTNCSPFLFRKFLFTILSVCFKDKKNTCKKIQTANIWIHQCFSPFFRYIQSNCFTFLSKSFCQIFFLIHWKFVEKKNARRQNIFVANRQTKTVRPKMSSNSLQFKSIFINLISCSFLQKVQSTATEKHFWSNRYVFLTFRFLFRFNFFCVVHMTEIKILSLV